ncbi:MAG: WecB/TagA/CpsF family glycosyltransferase [Deltaproteobacteria bacterium]|nr:WecB/TagA/CpsF family glycosyltransferase [Deltaproteobacteria bacterium]MBI4796844.1 WecB/TagA/CpsF family glycosyltransferase [Deltaproteobacteria bacterium]
MESTELLGIKITPGTMEEFCRELTRLIARERQSFIISANVYGINLAWQLPWLAAFYHRADLVYVDGAGVALGARLLGYRLPPRLTMADLAWPAAAYMARQGHSLYLLGNPPGVAAQAAERLRLASPGLKILGTHHGFFQKEGPENEAVIAEINHLRPDVLMVGLGMPLEQRWILDNYARVEARVFWNVGAGFQYWAGAIPRCPRWMADSGLEWLFRLLLEPRRLAKRYLWGNTVFFFKVLQARRRLARSARLPRP